MSCLCPCFVHAELSQHVNGGNTAAYWLSCCTACCAYSMVTNPEVCTMLGGQQRQRLRQKYGLRELKAQEVGVLPDLGLLHGR